MMNQVIVTAITRGFVTRSSGFSSSVGGARRNIKVTQRGIRSVYDAHVVFWSYTRKIITRVLTRWTAYLAESWKF